MDILLDLDHDLNELNSKTDEELAVLGKTDKAAAAVLISRFSRLVFIKSEIFANSESDCDDLHVFEAAVCAESLFFRGREYGWNM